MKIHAYASWPHYIDHLAPIFNHLPNEHKGQFVVPSAPLVEKAATLGINAVTPRQNGKIVDAIKNREPMVVASYADLRKQRRRPIAFLEHGAGQTYYMANNTIHGGYSGGQNRDNVGLFLCPNSLAADRNAVAYPQSRVEIVGCPKLDDLYELRYANRPTGNSIGFTFHWDCQIVPEAGTAFYDFKEQLETFISYAQICDVDIVGHGHPKAWKFLEPWWKQQGVEAFKEWRDVVTRIGVLVADNTSTIFEAAALDIPVVLLESPKWRKDVRHGLRFWDYANIGPSVAPGESLSLAIERSGDRQFLEPVWKMVRNVYEIRPTLDRMSTRAAVKALLQWAI